MSLRQKIVKLVSLVLQGRPTNVVAQIVTTPPNQLLKGRCALITGGTSGIGFAIAKAFLEAGATCIITGRSQERLHAACQELERYGSVYGYTLDNTDIETFDFVFQKITQRATKLSGQLDILVNNAGIGVGRAFPNTIEHDYDLTLETNLKGAYFLSQLFSKYMVKNNIAGNILNIESSSSLRYGNTPYVISKWGLHSLTLGLAKTLAPYGIIVNAIAPGPTATPMLNKSNHDTITHQHIPLGRYILPEEIANGAVFMVSNMGKATLGSTLYMTGGAGTLTQDDVAYNFTL